ncbi:hypothetical protein LEMLEM_LOCUS8990 [Lemmus lemmus]
MLWESLRADKKIQLLGFVKEKNAVGLGNNDQEEDIPQSFGLQRYSDFTGVAC